MFTLGTPAAKEHLQNLACPDNPLMPSLAHTKKWCTMANTVGNTISSINTKPSDVVQVLMKNHFLLEIQVPIFILTVIMTNGMSAATAVIIVMMIIMIGTTRLIGLLVDKDKHILQARNSILTKHTTVLDVIRITSGI